MTVLQRQRGGYVSLGTQVAVLSGTSIIGVPTQAGRISVRMSNLGNTSFYMSYGGTATSTTGEPVATGTKVQEDNYLGAISFAVPSGGSGAVYVQEVRYT